MIDRLILEIRKKGNPVCAGLDTKLEHIPESFLTPRANQDPLSWAADNIARYNRALLDEIADVVPCVKLQCACYEMYGPAGARAFAETVRRAREKSLAVIADGKRSDIGSSAQCYAQAYVGRTFAGGEAVAAYDADFATVNPYLGSDGIEPFVKCCEEYDKGVFLLVKTSNPSSGELQDLELKDGQKVYERMMDRTDDWGSGLIGENGFSDVGAVVGATWPRQAEELRERHPSVFFLLPGVGAQGASVESLCGCFDEKGRGAIINTSRAMLLAWKSGGGDGPAAARSYLLSLREEILEAFARRNISYNWGGIDFGK